ncbi:MAG TPA: PAC2 family protein [Dermatophilaceae bacterium]|nr:PAC2 family protein [Dermatophilaceae bacterium]
MQDPVALYQFEPGLDVVGHGASTLVVALNGFLDAGHAQRLLTRHLLSSFEHTVVATFDIDQLFDYRGRRPLMTFDKDTWLDYAQPELTLYRVVDANGVPFLLLNGVEPDYQWERTVAAVRQLSRALGVTLTVSVGGIPMAVPHTRPVGMTAHATQPHLKGDQPAVFDTLQVPASVAALLEFRLGQDGEQAVGYAIHVPHYLAQAEYPAAALAAIEALRRVSGLNVPLGELQTAAAESLRSITAQVEQTGEAQQVVAALEQQYDAFVAGRQRVALLSGDESSLPTADELGRELEAYLRSHSGE